MTPRDRVDWRDAPPIPAAYRELMDRLDREARQAILRFQAVQLDRLTERSSPVPSSFRRV